MVRGYESIMSEPIINPINNPIINPIINPDKTMAWLKIFRNLFNSTINQDLITIQVDQENQ